EDVRCKQRRSRQPAVALLGVRLTQGTLEQLAHDPERVPLLEPRRTRGEDTKAEVRGLRARPLEQPRLSHSRRGLDDQRLAALALTGSRERADDLVQDTYVRVLSRPRCLRNDDDLGYLLRVMRNTFVSGQRRTSSRPAVTTADELDWIEDPRAPQPQDVAETHLLYETIAELPRAFRDALV